MKNIVGSLFFLILLTFSTTANSATARDLFRDAFSLYQEKNYSAAANLFSKGLAIDPNDDKAWQYYGDALLGMSQRMPARRAYRKALSLAISDKDKALLESKIDNVKPNVVPGEACRAIVEQLPLDLVQKLVDKLPEVPEVVTGVFTIPQTVDNPRIPGNVSVVTTELCGEVYLIADRTWKFYHTDTDLVKVARQKDIYLLGYPHIGPIIFQNINQMGRISPGEIGMRLWEVSAEPLQLQKDLNSFTVKKMGTRSSLYVTENRPKGFETTCVFQLEKSPEILTFRNAYRSDCDIKEPQSERIVSSYQEVTYDEFQFITRPPHEGRPITFKKSN